MKLEAVQSREDRINFNRINKGRLTAAQKADKDQLLAKVEETRQCRDEFEFLFKASGKKFREAKASEEELKKATRNSSHTIKTCVEHFMLVLYRAHVSSYHGGEHEGNSCRQLMKEGDNIFEEIKQYLIIRNNNNALGNDNCTIDNEEIVSLCDKHGKMLVMFDNVFSAFYTKRGKHSNDAHNRLLSDLEHVRQCWVQLQISITPKLHVIFYHVPFLLYKFNGGFDKLEESRIEQSHQTRARDHHRLARMGDKNQADMFEVKLQNTRVNKEISMIQNEVENFTKRKLITRTLSLKKEREIEHRKHRMEKRNKVKEESERSDATTRTISARKRKLNTIVSV